VSGERRWLLALDTATNTVIVAAGDIEGRELGRETFEGRYRHSQELLPAVDRLVGRLGLSLEELAGIVAGTGPGAFTGLRVGLATAKTLAHELRVPVAGIPTSDALLADAPAGTTLWLPSGPRDRVAVTAGRPPAIVQPGDPPPWAPDDAERDPAVKDRAAGAGDLAVDLDGRAAPGALERGREAVERLPGALLRLGAPRVAAGDTDDPERLVPRYASPPRGASAEQPDGGVAWSRDPR
jgi:tRNA threonylcarbamoyl adenosine modification protein YeaZ